MKLDSGDTVTLYGPLSEYLFHLVYKKRAKPCCGILTYDVLCVIHKCCDKNAQLFQNTLCSKPFIRRQCHI